MIDRSRSLLKKRGFLFEPFAVRQNGSPLSRLPASAQTELIVFERGSEKRALLASEMAYHHVAQGELAGQPYLVSF